MNSQQVVDAFKEHLNLKAPDHTVADLTITGDRVTGRGAPESQRVVREDENEAAIGGLRNAARAVDRVPGWKVVGRKIAKIIEELVNKHQEVLDTVLSGLGDKVNPTAVPESLCVGLRSRLSSIFQMSESVLNPGPGGLFPGLVQALTEVAQDPDIHIHNWLRGEASLGITAPIPPGGVFPAVPALSIGKERDRIRYLNAKIWGSDNYSSYQEHRERADEVLQAEVRKGYVQWAATREELERQVGSLQLAKIAVIVKGEKVRLIHDMRRNGTNAKVKLEERLVLPQTQRHC